LRVTGFIAAVAADGLTVRGADGVETRFGVAPDLSVVVSRPVDRSTVKPGDFVATANLQQPNGEGRSIELRVFEPGSRLGEGSRPMAQPGQVMTNATVTKVATTAAGLELDVAYPGGERHIVVPPEVTVIASIPVDPAELKPGTPVAVAAARGSDGALRATRITITPPAPR
jgi:hypothetical protein